jgi:hypothetical protein
MPKTVTLSDDVYNLVVVTSTADGKVCESYAYPIEAEATAKAQFKSMCREWQASEAEINQAVDLGWYNIDAGLILWHYSNL